jgi:hypothetical protein
MRTPGRGHAAASVWSAGPNAIATSPVAVWTGVPSPSRSTVYSYTSGGPAAIVRRGRAATRAANAGDHRATTISPLMSMLNGSRL